MSSVHQGFCCTSGTHAFLYHKKIQVLVRHVAEPSRAEPSSEDGRAEPSLEHHRAEPSLINRVAITAWLIVLSFAPSAAAGGIAIA